ncbi:hypothetical protein [Pedobacter cryoconitis]|uniref:hypothetical protein n=1 Tax=Pedobacter cryoconitis TaxID=188932 RepID=UPI00162271DA|nr:hypothetical protein [Pedobacter cryoconitis]MBB5646208.1 hypothetical protein [Pedobacter cryoconitis]
MEKRKRITGNDTDKAMAKAGSSKPGKLKPEKPKPDRLKTQEPLAEKDEVKQAEDHMRKRINPAQKKT